MSMEDQETKNQHYIPQSVLANFSNNKQQVYEALVFEKKLYPTKYRNSMSQRNTYEHPRLIKNNLEKEFGKIESGFDSTLKKIINMLEKVGKDGCTILDIKNLVENNMAIFIIFYYRSGALLHEFDHQRSKKEDKINLLLDNILNSRYIKSLSETIISHYKFSIIKNESNDFLMSDQYIATAALGIKSRFTNVSNRHMGLKNVISLIPISSNYYIVYYDGNKPDYIKNNEIVLLNDIQLAEINEVIMNNSYVKCIGRTKVALENSLSKFEFISPSEIIGGSDLGAVMGATLKKEIFFYERDKRTWEVFTSAYMWASYRDLGDYANCICGREKKFKFCCKAHYIEANKVLKTFGQLGKNFPFTNDYRKHKVVPNCIVENGIGEFYIEPK
jgi:hypothetical protein